MKILDGEENNQNIIPDIKNVRVTSIKVLSGGRQCEKHMQDDCDASEEIHRRRRDLEISSLRDLFADYIKALGFTMPLWAS
jgi:hypothetical protein